MRAIKGKKIIHYLNSLMALQFCQPPNYVPAINPCATSVLRSLFQFILFILLSSHLDSISFNTQRTFRRLFEVGRPSTLNLQLAAAPVYVDILSYSLSEILHLLLFITDCTQAIPTLWQSRCLLVFWTNCNQHCILHPVGISSWLPRVERPRVKK